MKSGYDLDYTCAGCGAPAVRAPATWPEKGLIVTVPHGPGCPAGHRAAELRTQAPARMRR